MPLPLERKKSGSKSSSPPAKNSWIESPKHSKKNKMKRAAARAGDLDGDGKLDAEEMASTVDFSDVGSRAKVEMTQLNEDEVLAVLLVPSPCRSFSLQLLLPQFGRHNAHL